MNINQYIFSREQSRYNVDCYSVHWCIFLYCFVNSAIYCMLIILRSSNKYKKSLHNALTTHFCTFLLDNIIKERSYCIMNLDHIIRVKVGYKYDFIHIAIYSIQARKVLRRFYQEIRSQTDENISVILLDMNWFFINCVDIFYGSTMSINHR